MDDAHALEDDAGARVRCKMATLPSLRSALAVVMSAAALFVASDAAAGGTTTTFPYRQRTLLYSRDPAGALAYVTSGGAHGESLPVVVFLHGMNREGLVHRWFTGSPQGDLRQVVEPLVRTGRVAPLILAAPTHTRNATGAASMWPDFELADFLDATDAALAGSARVDRSRVVVVGHSGAGCNPSGGLLGEGVLRARPVAVVAIDTCVDERVTPRLASLAEIAGVRFYWHRSWRRPVADLAAACPSCSIEEVVDLPRRSIPHAAMVPEVLRRALPELLSVPGPTARPAADEDAQGTTRWMTTGSPSAAPTRS